MRKVLGLLVVVIAIGMWVTPSLAAEQTRVALVLNAQAPLSEDSAMVRAVFAMASRGLEAAEKLHLIPQDRVATAQHVLGFHLTDDASARQVHALATALDADALVLIQVSLVDGRFIVLRGIVFNAGGEVLQQFRSALFRADLEEQVQAAVKEILEKIVPALLKL